MVLRREMNSNDVGRDPGRLVTVADPGGK